MGIMRTTQRDWKYSEIRKNKVFQIRPPRARGRVKMNLYDKQKSRDKLIYGKIFCAISISSSLCCQ